MNPSTQRPTFEFDPEQYAHHIASLDLTPEQQDDYIRTVANIMLAMVDMGFGIKPSQLPCGQGENLADLIPKVMPDLLHCEHPKPAKTKALTGTFATTFSGAEQEES